MLIINHIVRGISGNFSNIDSQNDNILMIFRDQIFSRSHVKVSINSNMGRI